MTDHLEITPVAPKSRTILQKKKSQKKIDKDAEQYSAQQDNIPSLVQAKNACIRQNKSNVDGRTSAQATSPQSLLSGKPNGGIENAIAQTQEKARIEAKANDEMWGRIAKAVDIAMTAELPGRIDQDQVKHIIDAILECVLPKP